MSSRPRPRPNTAEPPDGRLRKSQLVGSFGPGALIDLLDDAVVVGGLDFWPRRGMRPVEEPRLRDALAEELAKVDRPLRMDSAFREPPPGDEREPRRSWGVDVLEFPRWFICQAKDCRSLIRSDQLERRNDRYVHACDKRGKPSPCVPVRFVATCRRGHLEDFPWAYFVHAKHPGGKCAAPSLKLREGRTGDFAELRVECVCGARRRLVDASVAEANPTCFGERPWLGPEGREECTERMRLLVRTASNGYFSLVVGALSIPEREHALRANVQRVWNILQNATAATLPAFRTIDDVSKAIGTATDAEVLAMVASIQKGETVTREPIRIAEFRQLVAAPLETPGEIPPPGEMFFARRISAAPPKGVSRIVVVPKLREVRVQVGFTRLEAPTPDLGNELDLGVDISPLGLQTDWLPASEIRGEGIFVQLDEALVSKWEKSPAVLERGKQLLDGYADWAKEHPKAPDFPGMRFYLLHSLSHLLMTALSLECGYAASAIHERIYCAHSNAPVPMAAILLSTGTPGAEGTLGGLVEQGRRVGIHLARAIEMGRLCSNDPVCSAHSPRGDLSERFLEGAACHGCLFVAECSCERFNHYLDRALVVPTLGRKGVAFFDT